MGNTADWDEHNDTTGEVKLNTMTIGHQTSSKTKDET